MVIRKAIIVTNDGDFTCLVRYLEEKGKLRMILASSKRFSSLFKPFLAKLMTIEHLKDTLKK
ncbi:MAG: hypothetical protein LBO70_08355 [Clostridiales Family XIII bacterium]|nr:hypothetical protein [Clostridiales Family XIII bacterium]